MFVFCVGQFALQANAGEPPALPECLSERFFSFAETRKLVFRQAFYRSLVSADYINNVH